MTQATKPLVVRVKFVNRRQLKQAWVRDLSKSTLFVRTDSPLPMGARVVLILELPDAQQVQIDGSVVGTVPPGLATTMRPAGMAVAMEGFEGAKRAQVEEYLRRNRSLIPTNARTQPVRPVTDPGATAMPAAAPIPEMELLVRSLRRLLWLAGDANLLGDVDHYQILGLSTTARTDEIRDACAVLQVLLDPKSPPEGLADRLTAYQRSRVEDLYQAIEQIERTLTDPELRAQYDAEVFSVVR